MPLTESDLDSKVCKHCERRLREHCEPVDGGWIYTPCLPVLKHFGLAPSEWWHQVNEHGLCLGCSRPAVTHFALSVPQATIKLGAGDTETIMPVGQVILRHPTAWRCPPLKPAGESC